MDDARTVARENNVLEPVFSEQNETRDTHG